MKPGKAAPATLFPQTIDDLFHHFSSDAPRGGFAPLVDVDETPDSFVIRAELPGVDLSDIELTVEADTLTLKGEKKLVRDVHDASGHIRERSHGTFLRTFKFPSSITPEDIAAKSSRGVLSVVVKKATSSAQHRIEIEDL